MGSGEAVCWGQQRTSDGRSSRALPDGTNARPGLVSAHATTAPTPPSSPTPSQSGGDLHRPLGICEGVPVVVCDQRVLPRAGRGVGVLQPHEAALAPMVGRDGLTDALPDSLWGSPIRHSTG